MRKNQEKIIGLYIRKNIYNLISIKENSIIYKF